jgi:hypothetical protein
MKIHLVGLRASALQAMIELHRLSHPPLHELVEDATSAEMIVFVGSVPAHGEGIVDSALPRLYPEKCFVYWDDDGVVSLLPGIYTNAERARWFDLHRTASHNFIDTLNPQVRPMPEVEKRYLVSFAGGSTSLLRKKLYKIDYQRADVLIQNTSSYFHWDPSQEDRVARQREYAETIAASRFGLCPRGASAGGLRLFEVMQMGVAPVLASDKFLLPEGPDWDSFLLRIPERKIMQLPEILERHMAESAERGRLARLAYEQWFAPSVMFNGIIATLVREREERKIPERWVHPFWGAILWQRRFRNAARGVAKKVVLGVFRLLKLRFIYDLNHN